MSELFEALLRPILECLLHISQPGAFGNRGSFPGERLLIAGILTVAALVVATVVWLAW